MPNKKNSSPCDIEFIKDESGLHISMKTERLEVRSILPEDEADFSKILRDPVVMKNYESGVPYPEEEIKEFLETCRNCTKNHDPFHAYVILLKKEFIGFVVIWHSAPGEAELAYAILPEFQRNGYVTEVVNDVLHTLVPDLMSRKYKLKHEFLKKIVAIVLLKHLPSEKILLRSGFKEEKQITKENGKCYIFFSLDPKPLIYQFQTACARKDRKLCQGIYNKIVNEDVDITAEEMANSPFGFGQRPILSSMGN